MIQSDILEVEPYLLVGAYFPLLSVVKENGLVVDNPELYMDTKGFKR